jgi:hypothetical protein
VTIDVGTVLRGTVCALYNNLLTRPTGAAVRRAIEAQVAEVAGVRASGGAPAGPVPVVATIDFSQVELLDFSCADEIVAKLLLRVGQEEVAWPGYVAFQGLQDAHLDPIETVLERHALALVSWHDGEAELFGEVEAEERRHWEVVRDHGPASPGAVARRLAVEERRAAAVLERLWTRRLVMPCQAGYVVPGPPGLRRGDA